LKFIRLLRVHQWVKNFLVLAPLILAHQFQDNATLLIGLYGVIAFSLLSSIVYIINDIVDLSSDRLNHIKKNRPLASGALSIRSAIMAMIILVLCFSIHVYLSGTFSIMLLIYFLLNLAYSMFLKKLILLDVFILTGFYLLRLFYGAEILSITNSHWFISFSFFFFLSLAEIQSVYNYHGQTETGGRDYKYSDLTTVSTLGMVCSGISMLIFTLYLNSSEVQSLYNHKSLLWYIQILMFYWQSRLWIAVSRGKIKEDPLSFVIKDLGGICVMLLVVILFFVAI
jgi:4-hydroxybenzoate polyprenyltransferase